MLSDDDAPEQPVASAEDEALEHMSRDAVMDRLSLLTVEQREVIVLRLIEDLSISDVAEIVEPARNSGESTTATWVAGTAKTNSCRGGLVNDQDDVYQG